MIPDLGKYQTEVLTAYGLSLGILIVMVGLLILRARRVKSELARLEKSQAPRKASDQTQPR